MSLPSELMIVFAALYSDVESEFGYAGPDSPPPSREGQAEPAQGRAQIQQPAQMPPPERRGFMASSVAGRLERRGAVAPGGAPRIEEE